MGKRAVIVHTELSPEARPDEADVLVQAGAVSGALHGLGYEVAVVPFGLDIQAAASRLRELEPAVVFNLVEAFDGDGRLIHLACSVLDHLGIPYTGACADAMFLTSNKVLAKGWMRARGIATPEWVVQGRAPEMELPFPGAYIVKALWEEASIGIDARSVQDAAGIEGLEAILGERSRALGKQCFAERFIAGREFNLSVLGGPGGPVVLPPAEIRFTFPDDRPAIVDYKAKWDEGSLEYQCTPRSFAFEPRDKGLLDELGRTALACWKAFDLRGYARVDFRVDGAGRPWVLEINANPCISPDSGFVAASSMAGLGFPEVVARIVGQALDGGAS
jgi:D-alanine-D-alanine ligase